MGADGADGVAEGGAVLDFQPFYCIGIVGGPALWGVVQQAGIESSAAGSAGLKENLGEGGIQAVVQVVDS